MGFVTPEFGPALAEIVLATGICVVMMADLFLAKKLRGVTVLMSLATLALAAWYAGGVEGTTLTFSGSYIADPLAKILKMFTLLVVAVVFVYSGGYLRDRGFERVFLAGLAFDFCVRYSAEDAHREGFAVVVVEDACRGIDVDGSMAATRESLERLGILRAAAEAVG